MSDRNDEKNRLWNEVFSKKRTYEEKDDSNNSGKHQDVPGDGNGSGGSRYNDDENDL